MNTKEYKDVIFELKGVNSIDQFIINSLKYFLIRSDDFDVISSCNESLFYQLAGYIDNPEHSNAKQILFATYGKMLISKMFNIIKQEALNNLCNIRDYIQNDFLLLTSYNEADKAMDKLEIIYNSILEIDYELNNS